MIARFPSLPSYHTNASSRRIPPTAAGHDDEYASPDSDALVSAQMSNPRAAVARAAPTVSSGAAPLDSFRSSRYFQAKYPAPAAIGTLRRKIMRHPTVSTIHPPTMGPKAPARAPAAAQVPIARPRASPVNAPPSMARLFGISSAAPNPCRPRAARSQAKEGAAAQASDAKPKTDSPI